MRFLFTLSGLLIAHLLFAQAPTVEWAKCFGGSSDDRAYASIQTSDGGYLICGYTHSSDGDVTQNHGGTDAWLVKIDVSGNLQWQKTYGGTGEDIFHAVIASGAGYVACGETSSTDGDVSFNHGMKDIWVVGITAAGNIIWEKTYGGSDNDYANDIAKSDSGFFVVGQTFSGDGDVTEYKEKGDGWLISIKNNGVLLDEKNQGGKNEDAYNCIIPALSGGFLIGGYTFSNNGNVAGLNHGGRDGWLVKASKSGAFQWTQCYGDTSDDGITKIAENSNGSFQVSGWKTDITNRNAWVFNADVSGNFVTGYEYGGSEKEYGGAIFKNLANRYIVAPTSNSPISGDLTCHIGNNDVWMIQAESGGLLNWQMCLGGTQTDISTGCILTADSSYLLTAYTNSNDQFVSGNHGDYDWWIVKLAPTCATYAAFNYSANGATVSFDNNSEFGTAWYWNFGDGNISYQKNPTHTYGASGNYEVCLITQATSCISDTFCTSVSVCAGLAAASYTYSIDNATVHFTNTSTNATQYIWSFGDGASSTEANPSHTYTMNGKYQVCLTALDLSCSQSTWCADSITVCVDAVVSQFSYMSDGATVNFTTTSNSPGSWHWTFGDGATSNEKDPQHVYTMNGTYEACLVITDVCGSDTSCETINICIPPTSGFEFFSTSMFTYNFIDESLTTDSWQWNFGDGTSSSESNPVHTYSYGGAFQVCLTTHNECGYDTLCKVIIIECPAFESGFTFTQSIDTVFFMDASIGAANAWTWYFDDGQFSNEQNPVHIYAANGVYFACLASGDGCSLPDTVCHKVTVVGVSANDLDLTTSWDVFPNPLKEYSVIQINLSVAANLTLSLLNVDGRQMKTIANGFYNPGTHTVVFQRENLAAGMYLIQLRNDEGVAYRKLMVD